MAVKKKNRVVLVTGDGKGKTTAALGMALRAVGHGRRVCVLQFFKRRNDVGEARALALLPGVEQHLCGEGFLFPGATESERDAHAAAAREGLRLAASKLADPAFGMVILDEVCGAVACGLLAVRDVLDAIDGTVSGTVVVLTGRDACPELIERADTVSRVACVKHGFDAGWPAQEGVEL